MRVCACVCECMFWTGAACAARLLKDPCRAAAKSPPGHAPPTTTHAAQHAHLQKVDKALRVAAVRKVKVDALVDALDRDRLARGVVLEHELLEEQEAALVRHVLAHLLCGGVVGVVGVVGVWGCGGGQGGVGCGGRGRFGDDENEDVVSGGVRACVCVCMREGA